MRVLHVIDSLRGGGAEKLLETSLPSAHKVGLDAKVVYLNRVETCLPGLVDGGISTLCLDERYRVYKRARWTIQGDLDRIDRFLGDWRPDIVHGHLFSSYIIAPKIAERLGCGYVLTEHSQADPWQVSSGLKARFSRFLISRSYRNAAAIVCVGASVKNYLDNVMKMGINTTVVIENCISDIYWTPTECSGEAAYDIVMCGRLAEPKNHLFAIKVFKQLVQCDPKLKIAIIGEGASRASIEAEIDKLELKGNIELLGYLSQDKVIDVLDHSRCFYMPSITEGLPLALVEGLSRGLPATVSNIPAFEPFVDNKTVFDAPLSNVEANVTAIKRSLALGSKIDRPQLKEKYSIETHNTALTNLYRSLLKGR